MSDRGTTTAIDDGDGNIVSVTGNKLDVNMSSDIQIGAVEIKDGDSDTRMDVETDGTKNAAFVQINSRTTGGGDDFFDSDGDNTAQVLKAGLGNLYSLDVINSNAANAFVQLFDVAAGSVTVGSTTPNYVLFVPANGSISKDFPMPLSFATAITYACTTTPTGNGDPTTGLTVSAVFK